MKTNTIIKVYHDNIWEYCRVKLDSKKFPYIVINNEKIIINSTEFPRDTNVVCGYLNLHMELVSGLEELKEHLSNPELTCDKLNLKQQFRVG